MRSVNWAEAVSGEWARARRVWAMCGFEVDEDILEMCLYYLFKVGGMDGYCIPELGLQELRG